ncbi:MAG: hypothetical protein HY360_12495 [Verrucomicrobia bacterium]|nr:hypothetical protein [Verrucomicrobiota bacterium]
MSKLIRGGMIVLMIAMICGAARMNGAEWWEVDGTQASSLTAILGENAESAWIVSSGTFSLTEDKALGKRVLTVQKDKLIFDGRTHYTGDHELRALVRLRTDVLPNASAVFSLAKKAPKDPGFSFHLTAVKDSEKISAVAQQNGQPLHDIKTLTEKLDWGCPFSNGFDYTLRSYTKILPGWPEAYRIRIEQDMAALPDHNVKWLEIRVELRKGHVRFWLDDRLVAEKKSPEINPEGFTRIELSQGVQLATYEITKSVEPEKDFLPIRLAGYANARELIRKASVKPDSLPRSERIVRVNDIPFVFSGVNPEGNDHVAVGRSLYREANSEDYKVAFEQPWGGSMFRDPARIQLRIPNGQYDSLYLIAASDDEQDHIPLITAMFFRPAAGFPESFEATVPLATAHPSQGGLATAKSAEATSLPVTLSNGRQANLWLIKIPLDPGRLSSFSDMDVVEVELTKKIYQFRYYPDPAQYGWHQGGRPSAVHVYAATLGEAPVEFTFSPDKFGHVWTAPEIPGYTAALSNNTDTDQTGKMTVLTKSYDGIEETKQEKPVVIAKGASAKIQFSVPVKLNGYHDISATLEIMGETTLGRVVAGKKWAEKRSFVRLAPDTRAVQWTEGKGALFGYWSYDGGHYTPKAERTAELMTKAGARTATTYSLEPSRGLTNNFLVEKHWGRIAGNYFGVPQSWAKEEPFDPKKCEVYQNEAVQEITRAYQKVSEKHRPDFVALFGESVMSLRLTSGNYPEYWGEPGYQLTPEEKESLQMHFGTAKSLAEAFRKASPNLKVLIEWGDPLFVIPLLKAGFPKNLIDGTALDNAGFERLPEQQLHQISLHRLYELKSEFAKAGISDPALYYIEGPFFPTEVGSLTWREQMDIQDRFTLISMAYGVKRFYSGWFAFDCGDWVGSEHYGGCGIQRRIPYCDPKPAYASYATMTDKLNEGNFDGWLKTGSLTTYCLRFKSPKGNVYTLWTVRGKRPVTLTFAADAEVSVTDAMNNTKIVKSQDKKVTVITDSSALYVTGAGEVVSAEVGEPDHSDASPAAGAMVAADLGGGAWKHAVERDLTYESNNFDTFRYPGRFSAGIAEDVECSRASVKRGSSETDNNSALHRSAATPSRVLVSKLEKQDTIHELMPWYGVLKPRRPVELKGAPSHLGLWVKGASDWGRVVYCLRDAKGERWISVGTKDQWNCDDIHSWSSFNFDGWRYLRFELPGHTGYDSYRKHGTTWWGSHDGDGIVDLPLTLEKIVVEQRSHILYVNDVQPVPSDTVAFGKLYAEYDAPEDATEEAVRISKLRMPMPKGSADLPNPIKQMERDGVGNATTITRLEPPKQSPDGARIHVYFKEAEGAKNHFVWVSAHADGRGAVNMTASGAKSGVLVVGLRAAIKFYFWVTYQDEQGRMSKPSQAHEETLVDLFKEK